MSEPDKTQPQHHAVLHPDLLEARRNLARYEGRFWGRVNEVNDFLALHLGIVFGSVWVVWVFFIWPIAAQYMSVLIQAKTSYYAQSWVQLFALPLFVYIGNRLQRTSDAQSESMHRAQTHIATVCDEVKDLTTEVRELVSTAIDLLDPGTKGGLQVVVKGLEKVESKLAAVSGE